MYEELKKLASAARMGIPWFLPDALPSSFFHRQEKEFICCASPSAVLALIAEYEQLRTDRDYCKRVAEHNKEIGDQLKAENEALRKGRTDWQAECLKRGFEYVRESDDHYVLADLPEMADLLGMLLGVEVRTKDNDAYEEANSRLNEQVEGLINTIHAQEALRKDAERLNWLDGRMSPVVENQNWAQPEGELVGYDWGVFGQCGSVREAIDDAMSKDCDK